MTISRPSSDTAHLYDGKTVRSAAPSRKKLAGQIGAGSEIPKDAIPQVEIPTFIESLLGGAKPSTWRLRNSCCFISDDVHDLSC